jgi:hypothetical protein
MKSLLTSILGVGSFFLVALVAIFLLVPDRPPPRPTFAQVQKACAEQAALNPESDSRDDCVWRYLGRMAKEVDRRHDIITADEDRSVDRAAPIGR